MCVCWCCSVWVVAGEGRGCEMSMRSGGSERETHKACPTHQEVSAEIQTRLLSLFYRSLHSLFFLPWFDFLRKM